MNERGVRCQEGPFVECAAGAALRRFVACVDGPLEPGNAPPTRRPGRRDLTANPIALRLEPNAVSDVANLQAISWPATKTQRRVEKP